MTGIEPVFEKGYPCWEAVNRGAPMAETEEITLKTINESLNQVLDRLSEIEMILNDPMHGLDLPEGLTMQAGTMVDENSLVDFDGGITLSDIDMSDTITINLNETKPTFTIVGDDDD